MIQNLIHLKLITKFYYYKFDDSELSKNFAY